MHTPPRILVVEDDDLQYEIYEEALSKDYELVRVTSGSQALASIPKIQPDLIGRWPIYLRPTDMIISTTIPTA